MRGRAFPVKAGKAAQPASLCFQGNHLHTHHGAISYTEHQSAEIWGKNARVLFCLGAFGQSGKTAVHDA